MNLNLRAMTSILEIHIHLKESTLSVSIKLTIRYKRIYTIRGSIFLLGLGVPLEVFYSVPCLFDGEACESNLLTSVPGLTIVP